MTEFWRRYRKVVALGTIGAAGAAAAYYWWNSKNEVQLLSSGGNGLSGGMNHAEPAESGLPCTRSTPAAAKDAALNVNDFEFHLHQHYESVQEITAKQTIPNWLHRVRLLLYQATELEQLHQQLRQLQHETDDEARDQKLLLWKQLAHASLTRAASTCWLIPILDLYLRVKLNMLGRHLYLESTLESMLPAQQWAQRFPNSRHSLPPGALPKLSSLAQEAFMNHSNFFPDGGAEMLVTAVGEAVDKLLDSFDLQQPVLPSDILDMLSCIHNAFELRAADMHWDAVLMGPESEGPQTFLADDGSVCDLPPDEACMIEEMGREVRLVLGQTKFAEALRAAVQHASRMLVSIVATKFPNNGRMLPSRSTSLNLGSLPQPAMTRNIRSLQDMHTNTVLGPPGSPQRELPEVAGAQMPFARVIGVMATACGAIFSPDGQCSKGIATLAAVQALCASVYTCGPRAMLI